MSMNLRRALRAVARTDGFLIFKNRVIVCAVGVAVGGAFYVLTYWWLPGVIHLGVCTYLIGPC